ncbi:universal stress protein [Tissierella creatinini]|nr:universal stress protein [Tissierella creatinini]TJX67280.1 universal stress protein [Soehngenia saccharolytica]
MKILVAVDGSKYSEKALFKARKIAEGLGSDVTILHVINPLRDTVYINNRELANEIKKNALARGDEVIKKSKEVFKDFSGKLFTETKVGDAVDEIIKFAEEGGFDLLVMGSRGGGAFSRALLGSVSDKVVHHIKTSVLIVK